MELILSKIMLSTFYVFPHVKPFYWMALERKPCLTIFPYLADLENFAFWFTLWFQDLFFGFGTFVFTFFWKKKKGRQNVDKNS